MTNVTRVLVPAGQLGTGVRGDELRAGLALGPHAIALDAGSTDSGAASLATGRSKYSPATVRRDLELLIAARFEAGVPLLIGSCGGTDNLTGRRRKSPVPIRELMRLGSLPPTLDGPRPGRAAASVDGSGGSGY